MLNVPWPPCRRSHPAGVARRPSQSAASHAAFARKAHARPPDLCGFRGYLCVHPRYGPVTHSPSVRWFGRWAPGVRFPSALPSKLRGVWLFAPVGLSPTEHVSFLDTRSAAATGLGSGSRARAGPAPTPPYVPFGIRRFTRRAQASGAQQESSRAQAGSAGRSGPPGASHGSPPRPKGRASRTRPPTHGPDHAPVGCLHGLATHHLLHEPLSLVPGLRSGRRAALTHGARGHGGAAATTPGPLRPRSPPCWVSVPHEPSVPVRLLVFGPSPPCAAATTTSAVSSRRLSASPVRTQARSPGVRRVTFAPSTRRIYAPPVRVTIGLRVPPPPRPPTRRLVCGSCPSGQGFAYGCLPTPPRDRAVAGRLGVPVTWAPRGLAPPGHFPVGFRLPVATPMSLAFAPCPAHGGFGGGRRGPLRFTRRRAAPCANPTPRGGRPPSRRASRRRARPR